MGLKGMSVGVRLDGSIDVEIAREEDDEDGWNFSNVSLEEAVFLHEELGRAIARQRERGFPRPALPEAAPSTS